MLFKAGWKVGILFLDFVLSSCISGAIYSQLYHSSLFLARKQISIILWNWNYRLYWLIPSRSCYITVQKKKLNHVFTIQLYFPSAIHVWWLFLHLLYLTKKPLLLLLYHKVSTDTTSADCCWLSWTICLKWTW